jgi:molybdate transport system substrate-binding protein
VRKPLIVIAAVLAVACGRGTPGRTVRVAAAADLGRAFDELAAMFQARTGIEVRVTTGSSGLLARQIEQGAPYFLFAAASRDYVDQVVAAGRCDAATIVPYARGRLIVWTPPGTAAPTTLAGLADPRFARIAIANPEHAPYGRAARSALEHAGIWGQVEGRIVLGENVQAAMQFARTGNADAAIVALSLAPAGDGGGTLRVDPALHEVLEQSLVICGQGEEAAAARQLAALITSPPGRELLTRYGFQLGDVAAAPR